VIKQFIIEEGETLEAGLVIGYIDSTQLYLKKKQLETQISALLTKKPDIPVQMASLLVQVKAAETELARAGNLLRSGAATQKLFDEISAQVEVLRKQVDAQRSSLEKSDEGITREAMALKVQIELLDDQLDKCRIINPVNGTVLVKYAEANEMTASGKPLYKIADLTTLILRAYITGNQLPQVKLNQKVKVLTDVR
jgi:HlyD family secretion protein